MRYRSNFALFTRKCQTVIFPSKASNNTTRKSTFAISVCNFPLLFSSWLTTHHATTLLQYKNLAGHGVHIMPFKFSPVPVKKIDLDSSVQIFVRLAWFCVNGTANLRKNDPKHFTYTRFFYIRALSWQTRLYSKNEFFRIIELSRLRWNKASLSYKGPYGNNWQ